jgi:hypothetical protein
MSLQQYSRPEHWRVVGQVILVCLACSHAILVLLAGWLVRQTVS